jgi:beta-lactamase regulating signal transducer with metallopeptidase domain
MLAARSSSMLRYALALVSLFLMAALPVLLLCKPRNNYSDAPAAYETVQSETATTSGSTAASIPIHRKADFSAAALRLVEPSVPWIAACWALGMALLFLKTIGGVIQVWILKRKAADQFEKKETSFFHRLAVRAGIADIPVLESNIVSTPTVAEWFRPVVLLPKGILETIGRPMLDALVAHEFAHIRRENLVNLFQTVVENLFFPSCHVVGVQPCTRGTRGLL